MKRLVLLCLGFVLLGAGFVKADIVWTTVDYPGAIWTSVFHISGSTIAGKYWDGNNFNSFIYDGTTWTTLNYPGATKTSVLGISGNTFVGSYDDSNGTHGFIYDGTTWTRLDYPGAIWTEVYGISGHSIVGRYNDANGPGTHGFLYDGISWTPLNYPGAGETYIYGISENTIAGEYWQANVNFTTETHSFLYDGTSWTTVDYPGATGTYVYGISGHSIVGSYDAPYSSYRHGFLYDGISWTPLNYPGATRTEIYGISGNTVAGEYGGANGIHGFTANIVSTPEPTPNVNVPNGVMMTQAIAQSTIITAGLVVGTVTQQHSDTVAKGLVISQNPVSGTSVLPNSSVNLIISLGSEPSSITVQKCSVTAGNNILDSISFSGSLNAIDSDFLTAMNGNVVVSVDSDLMSSSKTFTFPITAATYKKGKFSGRGSNTYFSFDTKKQKFTFTAKKIDLTGLDCPFTLTITIGDYSAQTQLEEDIVNGTKPIPFQLMMGAQNNLTVTKYKLKPGKIAGTNTDTLTAKGTFTIDGAFNPAQPFVISIGSQTFTVQGVLFINKNGVYSCKNAPAAEGGLVTAKLDYNKCTFTLSITKANITQHGEVDFEINCFGNNLEGLETITLN